MSWVEVNPDGKHRIFRCSECRRIGVTGAPSKREIVVWFFACAMAACFTCCVAGCTW
jgi:hypothetical protein